MDSLDHNPYAAPLAVETRRSLILNWQDWLAIVAIVAFALVGTRIWYQYVSVAVFAAHIRTATVLAVIPYALCLASIGGAACLGLPIRLWSHVSAGLSFTFCFIAGSYCVQGRMLAGLPSADYGAPMFQIGVAIVAHGTLWIVFICGGLVFNQKEVDRK